MEISDTQPYINKHSLLPLETHYIMITLDDYRSKVINEILLASSRDVLTVIDKSLEGLKNNEINEGDIAAFLGKTIDEIKGFCALDYTSEQWANLRLARILLSRIYEKKLSTIKQ